MNKAAKPSAADLAARDRRMAALKPLIRNKQHTEADVTRAAKAAGCGLTTLKRWLDRYADANGDPNALLPGRRGPKAGIKLLDERLDVIITEGIARHREAPPDKRCARVIGYVRDACEVVGMPPPHVETIKRRVAELPDAPPKRKRQPKPVRNDPPLPGVFDGFD